MAMLWDGDGLQRVAESYRVGGGDDYHCGNLQDAMYEELPVFDRRTAHERWRNALASCPVVAILRGVRPNEVLQVGEALVEAGIRIIEVPTNSPNAFESVRILAEQLPKHVVVGAGTVLTTQDVDQVASVGGTLVVSPNVDEDVVRRCKKLGLVCFPGVATPTEAFNALKYGATGLKAFPGEQLPPKVLKAWKAVLPKDVCLLAVGGVKVDNVSAYLEVGVNGFGIGSNIYTPGVAPSQAKERAEEFVRAFQELTMVL